MEPEYRVVSCENGEVLAEGSAEKIAAFLANFFKSYQSHLDWQRDGWFEPFTVQCRIT